MTTPEGGWTLSTSHALADRLRDDQPDLFYAALLAALLEPIEEESP